MYGKPKRDPVRSRSRSSFFVVSFYYLFFPPPFSRGRWRRRRVSGRYLTTTDVNSFARAQNRSLYSFELLYKTERFSKHQRDDAGEYKEYKNCFFLTSRVRVLLRKNGASGRGRNATRGTRKTAADRVRRDPTWAV